MWLTVRQSGLSILSLMMVSIFCSASSVASDLDLYKSRVLEAINAERSRRDLAELQHDDNLQTLADAWAEHLASSGEFRHRPDLLDRATALGFTRITENVWRADQPLPEKRVVSTWLNSPDHAKNLLSPASTLGAVGAARSENGRLVVVFQGGRRFRLDDF